MTENPYAAGPYDGVYRHRVDPREKLHATAKPLALMRELLICTPEGSTVVDPFAGSATTGVAAIESGRNFIGVELDEANFRIAADRLERTLQSLKATTAA